MALGDKQHRVMIDCKGGKIGEEPQDIHLYIEGNVENVWLQLDGYEIYMPAGELEWAVHALMFRSSKEKDDDARMYGFLRLG